MLNDKVMEERTDAKGNYLYRHGQNSAQAKVLFHQGYFMLTPSWKPYGTARLITNRNTLEGVRCCGWFLNPHSYT